MVGFDQPVVVDHAAQGADVDQSMQGLPAFATEAANPTFCRGKRQGDEEYEPEKTDGDERALGHVFPHAAQIEGLVGPNVGEKMQANVEKGEEAEHAAEADEIGKIQQPAKWRNGEGDEQEAEGPIAGEMLDKFDGVGGEPAVARTPGEVGEWRKGEKKDKDLRAPVEEGLAEGIAHVSNIS